MNATVIWTLKSLTCKPCPSIVTELALCILFLSVTLLGCWELPFSFLAVDCFSCEKEKTYIKYIWQIMLKIKSQKWFVKGRLERPPWSWTWAQIANLECVLKNTKAFFFNQINILYTNMIKIFYQFKKNMGKKPKL